jgi:hypothetical protein
VLFATQVGDFLISDEVSKIPLSTHEIGCELSEDHIEIQFFFSTKLQKFGGHYLQTPVGSFCDT